MTAAEFQEVPLNVNALAPLSTAAQKLGEEHDTDAMPGGVPGGVPGWVPAAGSLIRGAELHRRPLNRKADESRASTARQKLTVGHDTESGSPADDDSRVGRLHLVPSYAAA